MGVKGLQYYVEKHCPVATEQVSIVEMANRHRQRYSCKPVLVIDGMSVLHRLYKMDDLEWLYGGQWKQYVANFCAFVDRFKAEDIDLVFVFDGVVDKEKTPEWIKRRTEKLVDVKKIFYHIALYKTYPDERLCQLPAAMATLIRYALKYICGCHVINSTIDGDKEIVRYAEATQGCFAILSQDTDFIIFDTKPYLSVSHLKLGTLQTVMYNRNNLAQHLGITVTQLSLLACLMGNDYINIEKVRGLHRYVTQTSGSTKTETVVPRLADYVRESSWRCGVLGPSHDLLQTICTNTGLELQELVQGILYYSKTDGMMEPFPEAVKHLGREYLDLIRKKHRNSEVNSHIYTLLCHAEYKSSECLEDQETTGLLPSSAIFKPLRQRWYTLLFKHKPGHEVEEISAVQGVPILKESVNREPFLVFGTTAPTLEMLWNDKFSAIRWKTCLSGIGVVGNESRLQGVQPHFVVFACLINYLLENRHGEPPLATWEVDALCAQAVSPLANDLPAIRSLIVPFIEPRAVHLATIILRGLTAIVGFIQTCGEPLPTPLMMPWHFFDGKLFHYLYLLAKGGANVEELLMHDRQAIRECLRLRSLSISGTYILKQRHEEGKTMPINPSSLSPTEKEL